MGHPLKLVASIASLSLGAGGSVRGGHATPGATPGYACDSARGRSIVQMTAYSVRDAFSRSDMPAVTATLQGTRRDPDLACEIVTDSAGRPVAHVRGVNAALDPRCSIPPGSSRTVDSLQRARDELANSNATQRVEQRTAQVQEALPELEIAKDEAKAANRMKSEFLATRSPEVCTPMNGVLGTLALVLETRLEDEQRRLLRLAKSSADALLVTINDILDLSKIEAGRMEIAPAPFRFRTLMVDGVAATAAIRRREGPNVATPIIALTANAMESDRVFSITAGVNDHLTKPISPESLRAAVERWCPAPVSVE